MCHLFFLYCLAVDRKDRPKCLLDVQEALETPLLLPPSDSGFLTSMISFAHYKHSVILPWFKIIHFQDRTRFICRPALTRVLKYVSVRFVRGRGLTTLVVMCFWQEGEKRVLIFFTIAAVE